MASKKSALKIKDIDILRQCLKDNGSMQWKRCKPKLSKQENTRLTNAWKNDARYIQALMDPCKHQALEQLTILLHSNNRTNNNKKPNKKNHSKNANKNKKQKTKQDDDTNDAKKECKEADEYCGLVDDINDNKRVMNKMMIVDDLDQQGWMKGDDGDGHEPEIDPPLNADKSPLQDITDDIQNKDSTNDKEPATNTHVHVTRKATKVIISVSDDESDQDEFSHRKWSVGSPPPMVYEADNIIDLSNHSDDDLYFTDAEANDGNEYYDFTDYASQ
eukprot:150543_1